MMSDQPNYYAAPDAQLEPSGYSESDEYASRQAPTSFGDTISASIELYKKVFVPLIGISFVWGVIDATSDVAYEWSLQDFMLSGDPLQGALFGVALLVTVIGSVYFWAVGLKRVANIHRSGTFGDEWSLGVERFLPLTGYFMLMGMIVGGVGLLSMLLFLVPAILVGMPGLLIALLTLVALIPPMIVLFLLFVGDVHVVATGSGPIEGLQKSYELVKGVENWFFAFGTILVMVLMIFVPVFVIAACFAGATLVATESMRAMDLAVAGLTPFLNVLTFPFALCINYMLYEALLARKNFYYAAMTPEPAQYGAPQSGTPGPQYGGPRADDLGAPYGNEGQGPGRGPTEFGAPPQQGPPAGGRRGAPPSQYGPPPGAGDPWGSSSQQPEQPSGEDGSVDKDDDDSSPW